MIRRDLSLNPCHVGRASQQAVDESARSAERGKDAEAVAAGPGRPVCNAHRLREAQGTSHPEGGGPRVRAPFLFAGFLWASKENWLARQGETCLLAMKVRRWRVQWRIERLCLQVTVCTQRIATMFRPEGRAPFARPKGAEKGGCHCSGRRAYGAATPLRCSPSTGGSETRPSGSNSRPADPSPAARLGCAQARKTP